MFRMAGIHDLNDYQSPSIPHTHPTTDDATATWRRTKERHESVPLCWNPVRLIRRYRQKSGSTTVSKRHPEYTETSTDSRVQQLLNFPTTGYKSYVNNQIGDSPKTNPKRFWSFIRANKRENIGIPTLRVNDKPNTNDRDKANALNSQSTSVLTSERYPIPVIDPSLYSSMPPLAQTNSQLEVLRKLQNKYPTSSHPSPNSQSICQSYVFYRQPRHVLSYELLLVICTHMGS